MELPVSKGRQLTPEQLEKAINTLAWIDKNPAVASSEKEVNAALDAVVGHIASLEYALANLSSYTHQLIDEYYSGDDK